MVAVCFFDDKPKEWDSVKLPFISSGEDILKSIHTPAFIKRLLNPRFIIPAFAALVVLLAAVSIIVIKQEKKPDEVPTDESTTVTETVSAPALLDQFDSNFLLAFADPDDKTIDMLAVLHVNSEQKTASVLYVSPSARTNVNNSGGTILEHYSNGGINELVWAVGEYTGRSIDRYIIADSDDFISFAKWLDELELSIEEKISYSYDGIAYIIEKGEQMLTADTLFKYYAYLCDGLYAGGDQKLTDLLTYLLESVLCPPDGTPLDRQYKKIVESMNTNISARDVAAYGGAALNLLSENKDFNIINEGVFEG